MKKNIFIYSDKVKSGKTTKLFQWLATQKNIAGLLQPIINGKRFFYSIVDKSVIQLEISNEIKNDLEKNDLIKIGNYNFLKSGFNKAKEILLRDFSKDYQWLIIDEVGPLELNSSGLEPVISKIVREREKFNGNILIVVRDKLLISVIKHYKIENQYEVFKFPS